MKQNKLWLSMSDNAITQAERDLDNSSPPVDNYMQRNRQLKTQRRRALRRALSLERVIRGIMKAAASGTPQEVSDVFKEAERILNIPLHQAILAVDEEDERTTH